MEKNPTISLIITNFNYGKYVEQCIISTLNQTYQPIEIIVVDDASTDNSVDIINKYKNRIKFHINKQNLGTSASSNLGVDMSSGKYCALVNSDDWIDPTYVEKCYNAIKDDPKIGFVYTNYCHFKDNGSYTNTIVSKFSKEKLQTWNFVLASALFRKEIFKQVGGFTREEFEDYDLWLKFVDAGYDGKLTNENEFLYHYRDHENNRSIKIDYGIIGNIIKENHHLKPTLQEIYDFYNSFNKESTVQTYPLNKIIQETHLIFGEESVLLLSNSFINIIPVYLQHYFMGGSSIFYLRLSSDENSQIRKTIDRFSFEENTSVNSIDFIENKSVKMCFIEGRNYENFFIENYNKILEKLKDGGLIFSINPSVAFEEFSKNFNCIKVIK